jgi:hypothetical protein
MDSIDKFLKKHFIHYDYSHSRAHINYEFSGNIDEYVKKKVHIPLNLFKILHRDNGPALIAYGYNIRIVGY